MWLILALFKWLTMHIYTFNLHFKKSDNLFTVWFLYCLKWKIISSSLLLKNINNILKELCLGRQYWLFLQRLQDTVWSKGYYLWAPTYWRYGCTSAEVWGRLYLGMLELWWWCAVWLYSSGYVALILLHNERFYHLQIRASIF